MIKDKNHDNICVASKVMQLYMMWQTQQKSRICSQLPVLLVFLLQDGASQKSSLTILQQKSSRDLPKSKITYTFLSTPEFSIAHTC